MDVPRIIYIIERDVRQFFMYRWWMAGLISMNLADIFILAIIFTNMVRRIRYFDFVLPGIVVLALFASAFTIGREVSIETRRKIHYYILSLPFSDWEVIIGRVIAGSIRGLIYSSPLLLLTIILSPLPNPLLLLVIPLLLFVLSLGMSALAIFLATVIKNFDAYITLRGLLFFLLIFNSTVFYPLQVFERLPKPLYYIAIFNPITHGADILRDILQRGIIYLDRVTYLTFFSMIFLVVSSLLYLKAIRE